MKQIGQKKVYVTKRINGKETHTKIPKKKTVNIDDVELKDKKQTFDFNNEIVIGVNSTEGEKKEEKVKKEKKKNIVNHKKKKSNKKVLAMFSIIILIFSVIILALTAPIFNITDIQVEGNEKIAKDTIITLSGLKKGENIFKFNNSIINNLKENAYIDSVKITRELPGTVNISIKERDIKYQINLINSYVYIDQNGYILEISTLKKEIPIIVGLKIEENELLNKKRLEVQDLQIINDIDKIAEAAKTINLDELITEINVQEENDYVLYLESKNKKIYIGDTSNLTNKMLYVKKIIENEEGKAGIAFINGDISSGFKPYFREEN